MKIKMTTPNHLYNGTEDILKKSHLFIPVLKTIHKLLNKTEPHSDDVIKNRIVYIRDVFCNQPISEVLKDETDINNEKVMIAQHTIEYLKSHKNFSIDTSYSNVIKQITSISDELQIVIDVLISKNDNELHKICIDFCKHMVPIICVYHSRLK